MTIGHCDKQAGIKPFNTIYSNSTYTNNFVMIMYYDKKFKYMYTIA